jgi:GntR family transcriptional regulator
MFLRIDPSSGMPITRQIAEQIRAHCAGGTLAPGDRLPSVRQLEAELAVHQNTIHSVDDSRTAGL